MSDALKVEDEREPPALAARRTMPRRPASAAAQRTAAGRLVMTVLLAAAIPVLLFGGWMAYVTADRERLDSRRAAVVTVVRVAEQVSAELTKELEVAEALASSVDLDAPDLATFYEQSQRLTAARPLWETVSLLTPDKIQLLNILRPFGDPLGPPTDEGAFEEVLREKRPVIGGIGPVGLLSGKRLVSLRVPVMREGELRYVLTVGLVPSGISAILRDAGAPDGWIGAIVDAKGDIVARTLAEDYEIGRQASEAVRQAVDRSAEGFYTGRTLEGVEVETVFRKLSQPRGWSVHFGVPAEALNTPVLRSLYALIAGGLASLSLGGGLAFLVARDVAQRRREEEERAALELSVSEERGAVAVDAAELGTWRWDPGREEIVGSERMRALLNLPRASEGRSEAAWSTERFLVALHPDDRRSVRQAIGRCLREDAPIDLEVRALRRDGEAHWVRMHGRCPATDSQVPRVIHGVISDIEPRKRAEAERLRLLRSLAEAQESEQRRIARELHDQVGQTVTGLSLGLKSLETAAESGAPAEVLREQLQWLRKLANDIGRDIHRAAADLRPTAIDDLGLEKALAAYVDEWSKRAKVRVDVQSIGQVQRLPLAIETAAYRAVQEALTNVLKHAAATSVGIVLEFRERSLRVLVEDDGRGFDPDRITADGVEPARPGDRICLGIMGMRERLAVLAGSLAIETAPGAGTTLFIEIPLPGAG